MQTSRDGKDPALKVQGMAFIELRKSKETLI